MQHRDGRGVVVARALTVSATTLAVSATAHLLGGGAAPGPVLGAAGALLLLVAVPLARRGLRPAPLAAYSVLAQLAIHLLLSWFHPAAGAHVAVVGHHGVESASVAAAHGGHAVVPMLAAHVVGTVLVVLLATGADRAAASVLARWRLVRAVLDATPLPVRGAAAAPHTSTRFSHRSWLLGHDLARRGPPVAHAA